MWKKGDRVVVRYQGSDRHCTVERGGSGKISAIRDDTGTYLSGAASAFQSSDVPAPVTWDVGTRVQFKDDNGKWIYGTVDKGGVYVEVIHDRGILRTRAHARFFEKSDTVPESDTESAMMRPYTLRSFKQGGVRNTEDYPWSAKLCCNGVSFAEANYAGTGGSTMLTPLSPKHVDVLHQAIEDGRAWAVANMQHGDKVNEPLVLWIDWVLNKKPYNVSAREYLADSDSIHEENEKEKEDGPTLPPLQI